MLWPKNPLADLLRAEMGIIKTVGLAVLRRPHTPIAVRITWDEFVAIRDPEMERRIGKQVQVTGRLRRTDTARRLDAPWECPADIEEWCEETAWRLGAGYLRRLMWAPLPSDGLGPYAPGTGLTHKFGCAVYEIGADGADTIGQDCSELIGEAAAKGFWSWSFNCAFRKSEGRSSLFWPSWKRHDGTLEDDGSRAGMFPGWRENKWLSIAKSFETLDYPERTALCIPYDFVQRKVNVKSLHR